MENSHTYEPEAATNLYEMLRTAASMPPEYRKAYRVMNQVFLKALDLKTNIAGIRFGGPFAKTDYLLKEHKAPRRLRVTVNDARARMRKQNDLDDDTLSANFLYDLKAVCQFVNLVFKAPVPSLLEVLFPQNRVVRRGELKTECLRIIVDWWDETYIYGDADMEGTDQVKVYYGGTSDDNVYKDWDWAYLRGILKRDCQLNLVRPREKGGVLFPEMIIYEPDYLVDISAIASCFENYSTSHLNYLINKIKPSPHTSAIALGNLASQLLDECLYLYPDDRPYKESVIDFFKKNAMSLLTTSLSADFHSSAQSQKENIRHLIGEALPKALQKDHIKRFDATEVMVEPSFFSEMLGIQGRMDFLQMDQKVLIEQKSGKGGFPEIDRDTPVKQIKHYVQLLLYMLLIRYNNREQYEKNNRNVHYFLLYSKYRNGLLDLGFAPQLMFEALKTRNEIVAAEYSYTHGGIRLLANLTVDSLNTNHTTGKLWEYFQRPQLKELLAPIHDATELERAYYLRFLTFLETEHLMAKVGNQTKACSGFANIWNNSLEEKLSAGNIYCNLDLLSPSENDIGKVQQAVLQFTDKPDNDISNFRTGDIVILYPYEEGTEPDARKTMVLRCTIEHIKEDQIILNLRAAQPNCLVFWRNGKKKWAIEHDLFESSFKTLYQGMHAFLSAPQERKDLLLLQRPPLCDKNIMLRGDYGSFNELSLRVKQAKDLFLIIGPPGTGKTSYGLLNTLQEELLEENSSVLLLSYTNRAVDEICSKLIEEGIDFIRIGSAFSCETAYRSFLLEAKAWECQNMEQIRTLIETTRVFVGTTSSLNSNSHLFKRKSFSLSIIDEASQILEPHLIGLLSAKGQDGQCAIKKIVLIGDHKQLPAVVQQKEDDSRVNDSRLNAIHLTNCRLSLFERLLKCYRDHPEVVYMLTKQGRMHHDIALFPNYTFYQNKLQVVPLEHQNQILPLRGKGENGIADLLTTRRIAFIAVPTPHNSPSDKVNTNEALAIAATVLQIYHLEKHRFSPMETVGVIVPYRNQIAEVRKAIERSQIEELSDITIDTVERYQGSQRDYIVYGFTIQKYYQLEFLTSNVFEEDGSIIDRKLNVAMTRAREHLIMLGNPELLANNITFYKLMEYVRSKHGFFAPPLSQYLQGCFEVPEVGEDIDMSQGMFPLDTKFSQAYNQFVTEQLSNDNRSLWPTIILGRDRASNLDAIGYGRSNYDTHLYAYGSNITPKEQVLIYCHYLMRSHYTSSRQLFRNCDRWFRQLLETHNGRVVIVDVGCGPALGAMTLGEQLLSTAPNLQYIGIDKSNEMRQIGDQFISSVFGHSLRHRMVVDFDELDASYWQLVSEMPTLIILNFAFVFQRISSHFAEHLGLRISNLLHDHPLNRYVFIIQHAINDKDLNSYKVFKSIISPLTSLFKEGTQTVSYQLHDKEMVEEMGYELLVSDC